MPRSGLVAVRVSVKRMTRLVTRSTLLFFLWKLLHRTRLGERVRRVTCLSSLARMRPVGYIRLGVFQSAQYLFQQESAVVSVTTELHRKT